MPGLNQLKKFSTDVKDLGDEVKIRGQVGEKPATVPLPQGISEEDDSEDFVLGMPEPAPEEEAGAKEEGGEKSSETTAASEEAGESASAGSETSENIKSDIPDLDSILHPAVAAGDGVPDLSDFLSPPEASAKQKPAETPLEDLDLDALLKPSASAGETSSPSDTIPDLDSIIGNGAQPAQSSAVKQQAAPAPAAPKAAQPKPAAAEPQKQAPVQKQQPAKKTSADEFAFDGAAIDMNEGLPDEIAENDAGEAAEPAEEITSAENADEIPEAVEDIAGDSAETSVQPESQGSAEIQNFDLEPPSPAPVETAAVSAENAVPAENASPSGTEDFDL